MYLKILRDVPLLAYCGICENSIPNTKAMPCIRQMAYMWGHDTLEDKEARRKQVLESSNKVSMNSGQDSSILCREWGGGLQNFSQSSPLHMNYS